MPKPRPTPYSGAGWTASPQPSCGIRTNGDEKDWCRSPADNCAPSLSDAARLAFRLLKREWRAGEPGRGSGRSRASSSDIQRGPRAPWETQDRRDPTEAVRAANRALETGSPLGIKPETFKKIVAEQSEETGIPIELDKAGADVFEESHKLVVDMGSILVHS